MEIMNEHQFLCANCDEPFESYLPNETTTTSFNECEDEDLKHHNRTNITQCQNCDQRNTIYYCTDKHSQLATGD